MAWFSGYRISYETWCQWTSTLPTPEPTPGLRVTGTINKGESIRNRNYYLSIYIEWKDSLPLRNRRKMPRPRCAFAYYFSFLCPHLFEDERDENNTTVSVFLPVRWVEYTSEYQIKPGEQDYDERICEEQKSDRTQFQHFLKFVEAQGTPLDERKAYFGWKKDVDPHDDWRVVSFPILTYSMLLLRGLCVLSSIETTIPRERSFRALFLSHVLSVIPRFEINQ
jgi:hypothetical protein